jgi:hypothetical protein
MGWERLAAAAWMLFCSRRTTKGRSGAEQRVKIVLAAAYTIKGNATGSATPTDTAIPALTSKALPVSADILLIQDSAASKAFKKQLLARWHSRRRLGHIGPALEQPKHLTELTGCGWRRQSPEIYSKRHLFAIHGNSIRGH